MAESAPSDKSHGYEAQAETFLQIRNQRIGPTVVREWCGTLRPGSTVLDLGCGSGTPIADVLVEAGLAVHGVDAAPTMIAAFRERFPGAEAECAAVEESKFFGREFDAAIAWGLLFLLPEEVQAVVIAKVAKALKPGGRFLFTSPKEITRWLDGLTGEESVGLGEQAYRAQLDSHGLAVIGHAIDEGDNYYYFCLKSE